MHMNCHNTNNGVVQAHKRIETNMDMSIQWYERVCKYFENDLLANVTTP